jgi:predicted metal-dependent phosphoesterase TrpH
MRDGLLLCELHAHTTWSDGFLTLPELVDLYGCADFDVLGITDHTVRLDDPSPRAVDSWTWPAYTAALRMGAERALNEYGLLLIPGLELSDNQEDPDLSAHVLALGLETFVSLDAGIVPALDSANRQGAALIAAHPYSDRDSTPLRATRRIWRERELFRELIHRYELFNRNETFAWVAAEELPAVATGDVHRAEHLGSWKTLLPCEKEQAAVVGHLRSGARAFLTPFRLERRISLPVAA